MTITVHCPSCSTAFPVDPAKVPEGGVNARCSSCGSVFFVEKPDAFEDAPGEPTPDEVVAGVPEATETEPFGAPEAPDESAAPDVEAEGGYDVDFEVGGTTDAEDDGWGGVAEEPAASDTAWDGGPGGLGDAPEAGEQTLDAPDPGTDMASVDGEPGMQPTDPAQRHAGTVETGDVDDWVFERDPEIDPATLDVEPMETVESSQSTEEPPAFPAGEVEEHGAGRREPAEWESEAQQSPEAADAPADVGGPGAFTGLEGTEQEEEPSGEAPESLPEPTEAPAAFQFGRRDPHDKAKRLARVLVSDMIMYNPERHTRALSSGSLREDFEEEIKKSWDEYVEQVGQEIAGSTSYFSDALNDILARGDDVFQGSPPV